MARMKNLSQLVGNDAPAAAEKEPTPTATEKVAEPAPVEPEPVPTPKVAPAAKKPRTTKRTVAPSVDPETGERETATKGVPVHLTEELDARLQAYMEAKRWSHQTVLLDAIEATYVNLGDLIQQATATVEESPQRVALFDRPSRPAPKTTGEARVKHTIRMTESNRNTLDRITEELGAPSRNFLITVAYEAYLPHIEKS